MAPVIILEDWNTVPDEFIENVFAENLWVRQLAGHFVSCGHAIYGYGM